MNSVSKPSTQLGLLAELCKYAVNNILLPKQTIQEQLKITASIAKDLAMKVNWQQL